MMESLQDVNKTCRFYSRTRMRGEKMLSRPSTSGRATVSPVWRLHRLRNPVPGSRRDRNRVPMCRAATGAVSVERRTSSYGVSGRPLPPRTSSFPGVTIYGARFTWDISLEMRVEFCLRYNVLVVCLFLNPLGHKRDVCMRRQDGARGMCSHLLPPQSDLRDVVFVFIIFSHLSLCLFPGELKAER
jgi:hypothetical protein